MVQSVQYVKICSLYGVGFYYVPGTDMCIKIGGWVRAEYAYGDNGNFAWGWANNNANNRNTNNSTWRARGYITADARNQTEYGTVRGYLAVGLSTNNIGFDNAGNTFSSNRAFIQWAGFTFGLTQSFFDFYNSPATSYWGSFPASDTGDGGWMVAAYTAQFGNGFSGSIAAEMRRTTQIVNSGTFVRAGTGAFPGDYGGFQSPDVVANLRVDQAWGSAQVMGAIHQVNATYYGGPNAVSSGHPDDDVGFAVGAGLRLNAPMISQGDYLQAQINYTQGALRYIFQRCAVRCGLWRHPRGRQRVPAQPDHGLERQRRLRALLESAVAHLALRRLRRGELQRPGQQDPLLVAGRRRGKWCRHYFGRRPGLQQ